MQAPELAYDKHQRTLGSRNADVAPARLPAWPPKPMPRCPDAVAGALTTLRLLAFYHDRRAA
jgi:hypothetical protein